MTEITGLTGSRGQSQLLVEYLPQMWEEIEGRGGGKEGDSIRKRGGEGGEKGEMGKEREGGREHEE